MIDPYKKGDRVVSATTWRKGQGGVVTKPGRGTTVMMRWDGADEDERVYCESIRAELPSDVSRRDHADAMDAWRETRPNTDAAKVEYGGSYSTSAHERGASVRLVSDSHAMRRAAYELQLIADWFDLRPKEPS